MAKQITQLPSTPQRTDDEQTFATKGDNLLSALPQFVTQTNEVATEVEANKNASAGSATTAANRATDAATSATNAGTSASNAAGSATTASTKAAEAATSASNAATSATNAATSASQAAQASLGLIATSSSSVTIGVGTKSFNVGTGKSFIVNAPVMAVSAVDSTQYVAGTVASYNASTLAINVTDTSGSGSYANWNISVIGLKSLVGFSGTLTGALNENKGADVATSASPNIWSGAGNTFNITGTTTITGFTNAPQAGAKRTLIAKASFTLTNNASITVFGGTQVVLAGDEIDVLALTTTTFRADIRRSSGKAVIGSVPFETVMVASGTWVVDSPDFKIVLQGAGSGGLSSNTGGAGRKAFSGGSSGGYIEKTFRGVPIGTVCTYIQGAAGVGASIGTNNGTDGGDSTFTVPGFGTFTAGGGKSHTTREGGGATGGDLNIPGQVGGDRVLWEYYGQPTVTFPYKGGDGADSMIGRGGVAFSGEVGRDAVGYGAGGAGGSQSQSGENGKATNGTPGLLKITR